MKPKGRRIMINLLKYGLFGIMGLFIVINLYLGINKAVTHNPVPKFLGMTPLIVMSGSMEPAIMPGDVVVIREQAAQEYKLGDIATYLVGTTTYTHRIVAEVNGAFILKGDNNNVADDKVPAEKFVGKVLFKIPKIGVAVLFFKTPLGMLVLMGFLVLCFYAEEVYRNIRYKLQINRKHPAYE